jgi:hypothetical protein
VPAFRPPDVCLCRGSTALCLLAYTANLPASLIGLEACAGAHFVGAALHKQGHEVRLIPAQFVKPYRKSNKNDFLDAEAIAEAVTKQNMRFAQVVLLLHAAARPEPVGIPLLQSGTEPKTDGSV